MKISYKNTTYNTDIAELLEDDVRKAWEEGHQYSCVEAFQDDASTKDTSATSMDLNRVGFIMFEMGIVRKVAILVYEYVEPDYRDKQIGTQILVDYSRKLQELGYKAIYASVRGHAEDIESKRYFLDSQDFVLATNIQIPTYIRKDIVNSEWYSSVADNEALRRVMIDVNKKSDHEIIHKLAKAGIILSDNIFIKAIVQDEKLYGAVLYGIEDDALIIYDLHIFEKKQAIKIYNALLLAVFIELNQMNEDIIFVKICTNQSVEMDLIVNNFEEPYDLEFREEWILRLE